MTDILSPAKRPRGRPATVVAMSAAERQRARRERLRAVGGDVLTVSVDADVLEALRKFVEFKDMTQGEAVTRILRDRLLRKR
jgi:formylmethanofuran:tetrahydromethanopterin formyltransferase